jgi:hypothetical protein
MMAAVAVALMLLGWIVTGASGMMMQAKHPEALFVQTCGAAILLGALLAARLSGVAP